MRTIIWIAALLPLAYMTLGYFLHQGYDGAVIIAKFFREYLHLHLGGGAGSFVKFLQNTTAMSALNIFIVTLAIRPLHSYLRFDLQAYKRLIGLFGFFYLLLHVTVFIWLKHHFHIHEIFSVIFSHLFLIFGLVAFIVMTLMAVTSIPFLYKKFHSWHKLFYIAMVFVLLHFLLGQKHISFTDIVYVAVISGLLALKLLKR